HLHIQAAAHSFSPLALAPVLYRRLDRKRRTAVRYGVQPIWLVLANTHRLRFRVPLLYVRREVALGM
ncbi:MAG: hypothetical protein WBE30_03135, partial [Candidatus Cybelea sp.]